VIDILGIFSFDRNDADFKNTLTNNTLDFYKAGSRIAEKSFSTGRVFYLDWAEKESFYMQNNISVFIYGVIFSNKKYGELKGIKPNCLSPKNMHAFYNEHGVEITKYIKGDFVLIICNDNRKEIIIINSRLNTLPLFYYYKQAKFIFSSSVKAILDLPFVDKRLNEKALVEQAIFHYPLGGGTYFKDIYQLPPSSILKFHKDGVSIEKYWSSDILFNKNILSENESLSALLDLIKDNLRLYTSDADKFLLSLTGGFDGRMNLASIGRSPKDFLCYSYGVPGSRQIEIPKIISQRLGLNYKPIYLDKEFEEKYEEYALKVMEFSDGTAPILRANFPYAFELLSDFSKINITGLFGSEIIKPFYNAAEQVSQETIDLFRGDDFDKEFGKALTNIKKIGFIRPNIIDKYAKEIREDFKKEHIQRLKPFDKITKFYIFLLEEAIRKYFMQEIRIERYYVNTRAPYFDDDFLELIFRTPFAGIYKGPLKKNPLSRIKGQEFYSKIIGEVKPILGEIITDRGYKPNDLLLPLVTRFFNLGSLYLKEKVRRCLKRENTFKSLQWPENMVRKNIYKIGKEDDVFTDKLKKDFEAGLNLKSYSNFFSIFSLRLWLCLNL